VYVHDKTMMHKDQPVIWSI